jgi:aldehyde dehydrogenase (NAD+)
MLFAEMIDEAGFPPGVFNLINGAGDIGAALSAHPEIDMVSFTGSTQTGTAVSIAAAATIKRVTLELGGKSPLLIFADADLEKAVKKGLGSCFVNTGQSCNAATRMLVEASVYDRAVQMAKARAEATRLGDPAAMGSHLGPLASAAQYAKVQSLIESGIAEGASLLVGGPGKPEGFERGYYVRPTIFTDVKPDMRIYREEIFGPVLCMMPFSNEDEALELANDTLYGLSAYLYTADSDRAQRLARRLRAGMVQINGASQSSDAPFGGYKQSGNGRELGEHGLLEFLEVKSISGL